MKIRIVDEFPPEATAMMQALYSRSLDGVDANIKEVRDRGPNKFLKSYYVGYGHKSIGDCGTTTIFIEDVSLLAAKAIQDNSLYCGVEGSTRYIDWASQPFYAPFNTRKSAECLDAFRTFYVDNLPIVIKHMKARFPIQDNQNEDVWLNAVKARAFDVMRGFLPAAATTKLSWCTNLRQAAAHVTRLRTHPLEEVRTIGNKILEALKFKYPSSFGDKNCESNLDYHKEVARLCTYTDYSLDHDEVGQNDVVLLGQPLISSSTDMSILENRPKYAELPAHLAVHGRYRCRFYLDYGSFRDLQRHRNGLCRMPIIPLEDQGTQYNEWYMDQLPEQLQEEADALLRYTSGCIRSDMGLPSTHKRVLTAVESQYYRPLCTNVVVDIEYSLPEMVYVAELRSGNTVHPTLRRIAQELAKIASTQFPHMKLYADMGPGVWDLHRGTQTITKVN